VYFASYNSSVKTLIYVSRSGAISRVFLRYYSSSWTEWIDLYTSETHPVQSSPTDRQAGKLLSVGAFGLGGAGPIAHEVPGWSRNFDHFNVSGCYTTTGSYSNGPLSSNHTGMVWVNVREFGNVLQVYFGSDGRIFHRADIGNAWYEHYHSGNLDPVNTARTISAGNGLTGGGNLAGNRTISMGTPGTIGHDTNNNANGSSHTHAVKQSAFGNTRDGINDGGFVTPETLHGAFLGPSASHSARGYQRLPGGFLHQWSFTNVIAAGQSQTLSFPITFPSNVFYIGLSVYRTSNAANENNSCSFAFNGRSSVIVRNHADTNKTIYVTALGV
jgi:hypothetical protein